MFRIAICFLLVVTTISAKLSKQIKYDLFVGSAVIIDRLVINENYSVYGGMSPNLGMNVILTFPKDNFSSFFGIDYGFKTNTQKDNYPSICNSNFSSKVGLSATVFPRYFGISFNIGVAYLVKNSFLEYFGEEFNFYFRNVTPLIGVEISTMLSEHTDLAIKTELLYQKEDFPIVKELQISSFNSNRLILKLFMVFRIGGNLYGHYKKS